MRANDFDTHSKLGYMIECVERTGAMIQGISRSWPKQRETGMATHPCEVFSKRSAFFAILMNLKKQKIDP
jgi:hypothetical protein